MSINWHGVFSAITTPFNAEGGVDHDFLAGHARWLVDEGCIGIVPLGSLGEGATLSLIEKRRVLETVVSAVGQRVPVVAGIAALATVDAVALARMAEAAGCRGLMVLPPYAYSTDWREMRAHVSAVIAATGLECMLYNNPVAYRTDFRPEQIVELAAAHVNLTAVKESSTDVRRVTAIRNALGNRLAILVGVDDAIVEGIAAGAVGWIAGVVNAMPKESVAVFNHARAGRHEQAAALYRWMLPLLVLDTLPKFVQLIKLLQQKLGRGSARVRGPRLALQGDELSAAEQVIDGAIATRPAL